MSEQTSQHLVKFFNVRTHSLISNYQFKIAAIHWTDLPSGNLFFLLTHCNGRTSQQIVSCFRISETLKLWIPSYTCRRDLDLGSWNNTWFFCVLIIVYTRRASFRLRRCTYAKLIFANILNYMWQVNFWFIASSLSVIAG